MYGHAYALDHGHVVQGQTTQVDLEILEHRHSFEWSKGRRHVC